MKRTTAGLQPGAANVPCAIVEITDRSIESGEQGTVLSHQDGASYASDYDSNSNWNATMNAAGGTTVDFTGGRIFNLGPQPSFNRWSVEDSGGLLGAALMFKKEIPHKADAGDTREIAANIIMLKAQYGYDALGNGTVVWKNPSELNGNAATLWERVVAVRFALLARDNHYRAEPYQAANPIWAGGAFDMSAQSSVEWERYSYEVQEAVVSLRNYLPLWK